MMNTKISLITKQWWSHQSRRSGQCQEESSRTWSRQWHDPELPDWSATSWCAPLDSCSADLAVSSSSCSAEINIWSNQTVFILFLHLCWLSWPDWTRFWLWFSLLCSPANEVDDGVKHRSKQLNHSLMPGSDVVHNWTSVEEQSVQLCRFLLS